MTEVLVLTGQRVRLELQQPADVLQWVESLPAEVRSEISADWLLGAASSRGLRMPLDWWNLPGVLMRNGGGRG